MLDWYSGAVGYDGSGLDTGFLVLVGPGGVLERRTSRSLPVMGSFESSVLVGSRSASPDWLDRAERLGLVCNRQVLWLSGNPSKFLQGHNAFGPVGKQLAPTLRDVVRALPDEVRPLDADRSGALLHRTRVDLNVSVDLESDRAVHAWLVEAGRSSRSRRGDAELVRSGLLGSPTVYWQRHSRRWSFKAYCKWCELREHPPAVDQELAEGLRVYCEGHLRLELTLRSLELRPLGTLFETLVWDYMARLEVPTVKDSNLEQVLETLPRKLQRTFLLWAKEGDVLCGTSRRTFYTHRREILDLTGFDISLPPPLDKRGRLLGVEELREREVRDIPEELRRGLHDPGPGQIWSDDDVISAS